MAVRKRKNLIGKTQTKSRIPVFKTIEEEAEFWDTHDSAEFEDEFEEVTEDIRWIVTRGGPKKRFTIQLDVDTLAELRELAPAYRQAGAPWTCDRTGWCSCGSTSGCTRSGRGRNQSGRDERTGIHKAHKILAEAEVVRTSLLQGNYMIDLKPAGGRIVNTIIGVRTSKP